MNYVKLQENQGGLKLYFHQLEINYNGNTRHICFLSTYSQKIKNTNTLTTIPIIYGNNSQIANSDRIFSLIFVSLDKLVYITNAATIRVLLIENLIIIDDYVKEIN